MEKTLHLLPSSKAFLAEHLEEIEIEYAVEIELLRSMLLRPSVELVDALLSEIQDKSFILEGKNKKSSA